MTSNKSKPILIGFIIGKIFIQPSNNNSYHRRLSEGGEDWHQKNLPSADSWFLADVIVGEFELNEVGFSTVDCLHDWPSG